MAKLALILLSFLPLHSSADAAGCDKIDLIAKIQDKTGATRKQAIEFYEGMRLQGKLDNLSNVLDELPTIATWYDPTQYARKLGYLIGSVIKRDEERPPLRPTRFHRLLHRKAMPVNRIFKALEIIAEGQPVEFFRRVTSINDEHSQADLDALELLHGSSMLELRTRNYFGIFRKIVSSDFRSFFRWLSYAWTKPRMLQSALDTPFAMLAFRAIGPNWRYSKAGLLMSIFRPRKANIIERADIASRPSDFWGPESLAAAKESYETLIRVLEQKPTQAFRNRDIEDLRTIVQLIGKGEAAAANQIYRDESQRFYRPWRTAMIDGSLHAATWFVRAAASIAFIHFFGEGTAEVFASAVTPLGERIPEFFGQGQEVINQPPDLEATEAIHLELDRLFSELADPFADPKEAEDNLARIKELLDNDPQMRAAYEEQLRTLQAPPPE